MFNSGLGQQRQMHWNSGVGFGKLCALGFQSFFTGSCSFSLPNPTKAAASVILLQQRHSGYSTTGWRALTASDTGLLLLPQGIHLRKKSFKLKGEQSLCNGRVWHTKEWQNSPHPLFAQCKLKNTGKMITSLQSHSKTFLLLFFN